MESARVVEVEFPYTKEFNEHPTRMVHKTPEEHKWREETMDEYTRDKEIYMGWNVTEGDGTPDLPIKLQGHYLGEVFLEISVIHGEEFDGIEEELNCNSDEDLEIHFEVRCSAGCLHLQLYY
ncbi:hypothetical protein Y032_0033g2727 [Ancylostoma ceylanicum]|uniref:Uncharacterized protein n=1 Tax=Ancylostoma ceylanicum TaxID=53326 RepID=A0A016UQ36_9BILA|nr:hypothetical protein Y032_0033g2727 [Ancylostoma ceylanicum]